MHPAASRDKTRRMQRYEELQNNKLSNEKGMNYLYQV